MADTKDILKRLAKAPDRERVSVFINKQILDDFKKTCKRDKVKYNEALEEMMLDVISQNRPKR